METLESCTEGFRTVTSASCCDFYRVYKSQYFVSSVSDIRSVLLQEIFAAILHAAFQLTSVSVLVSFFRVCVFAEIRTWQT